jgi:hypothetical protein
LTAAQRAARSAAWTAEPRAAEWAPQMVEKTVWPKAAL